ncbi:hypothetical protein J6590_031751 [Homalodisca vitripennis]|nr:hypothetical protein J6590_031751 [Homalodisca vitripennis]
MFRHKFRQDPSVNNIKSEVRAKKPSLLLNLGTNPEVTSELPPTSRHAGCLQEQDRSTVTHASSSHARRCIVPFYWHMRG